MKSINYFFNLSLSTFLFLVFSSQLGWGASSQITGSPPVALDDFISVITNNSVSFNYLTLNDSDPENDPLTIINVMNASNGVVTDNGGGNYTYTPTHGFAGSDQFQYEISDGQGNSATATVNVTVNLPINADAVRSALLAGVSTFANPNAPGYVVAFASNVINVTNFSGNPADGPMAVAATWGHGRVIAMGDHQWLRMNEFGDQADMKAWYINSLNWLAQSTDKSAKIVLRPNSATKTWLNAQGYTNVVETNDYVTHLATAKVLVGWLTDDVTPANQVAIANFVKNGGGMFSADYGQGYVWWWNKPLSNMPSNLILREAGIAYASGYVQTPKLTVTPAPTRMSLKQVMAMLKDQSGYTPAQLEEGGTVLKRLCEVLSKEDILFNRIFADIKLLSHTVSPSPATPLEDNGLLKAAMMCEMQILNSLPLDKITAHRTAEAVFGKIPASAARLVQHVVSINTNKTGWLETGMYAAPGEVLTLTFPPSLIGKNFHVQLSGHEDNISIRKIWRRMPHSISKRFNINEASVQIGSAFGGAIYIDVGGKAGNSSPLGMGNVDITIDGAIQAPYFILGQSTDQQWLSKVRDYPAPYAEFVSDGVSFSVPSSHIRTLDNPTELMTYWNEVMRVQDYVAGNEIIRKGPERINVDVQISVGLLHAGYPIQGPDWASKGLTDYDKLMQEGDWGYFHELGHQMQHRPNSSGNYYTFNGDVEVTVNIFANAALEKMVANAKHIGTGWAYSVRPDLVMKRAIVSLKTGGNFDNKDPYPFYFQLADGFGWDIYRKVMQSYNDDFVNNRPALPTNNAQRKDQWLLRFSKAAGRDLTRYMVDTWGLTVSLQAKNELAALNLPAWMPDAIPAIPYFEINKNATKTLDLTSAGLSLDGIATLINVGAASYGQIKNNGDGTYTYRPNTDYVGADAFNVIYRSGDGTQASSTINIDVLNAAGWDLNAALNGRGENAHFFRTDNLYVAYSKDLTDPEADDVESVNDENWKGLKPYRNKIVASFSKDMRSSYFFLSDGHYLEYDNINHEVSPGYPKPIDDTNWKGLGDWSKGIVATLRWTENKVYFLMFDHRYLRFDLNKGEVDRGPRPIGSDMRGMRPYAGDITAALKWDDETAYFFLTNQRYIKFNIATNRAEEGEPKSTIKDWPELLFD